MTISLLILLAMILSWRVNFRTTLSTGFERKSGVLFLREAKKTRFRALSARGATNLISGLRGAFCGGAAVVGGSGAE
jgi:hypothetical protein